MMTKTRGNTYLDDYNFVVIFPCDWETPWRGRYLIETLSKLLPNSKILCVENPIDLVVSLFKHPSQFLSRMRAGNVIRRVRENLYVYRPWIFLNVHLAAKCFLFQKLNFKWMKWQLGDVVKRNNFRTNSLITWFTDPFQVDYVNILDSKLKIFDCYDEYASQSSNIYFRTKKELIRKEKKVLQYVDLTFVVSDLLYENKQPNTRGIHLIPNGVDVDHFSQVAEDSTIIPEDILEIPHPIIGFHGNLSDRIDIDLLQFLAERNKDWSFVLVGGGDEYMRNRGILIEFAERINVYMLGNRPYEDLPGYLKAFDVCMIPFRQDDLFSLSSSPLKLYEYLTTGKPIVSTNLPGVFHFNSLIRIAKSKLEFEQHIKESLREKAKLNEERITIAENYSWKKRAEEIIGILEEALKRGMD